MALQISDRVRKLEYAIRDLINHARELEIKGKNIIYLNIGDPLIYDFETPEHIKKAFIQSVNEGHNYYAPSEGFIELRQAISEKERRENQIDISYEDVVVTSGVSEAIHLVMGAIVDTGGEVLLPEPIYPPYREYVKFFGGKPTVYKTIEENGWQPDINDIASKISDATRAIVIINPNNPCGSLYSEKILREIINITGSYNSVIISDEIYHRIVYEKSFVSTSRLANEVPVIGFNGFSKVYLTTGWRLGYMYFHDPQDKLSELKRSIHNLARMRLCASTPAQKAAIAALKGPEDHIKEMLEKLRVRRDFTWKRLNSIEGISCVKPDGTFYMFPKIENISHWKSDKEFVKDVLETTGILLVQGSGFGEICGPGHFRIVFLPKTEILKKALDLLENFLSS
jgi:aspartate/methionine/tyrosine aminotransferase